MKIESNNEVILKFGPNDEVQLAIVKDESDGGFLKGVFSLKGEQMLEDPVSFVKMTNFNQRLVALVNSRQAELRDQ